MVPCGADYRRTELGQRLYGSCKTAFMTSSLVFMNYVFIGYAVDDASSFLEDFVGCGFVAGIDCLTHALNGGAHHGTQTGIMLVARNRLTGALTCLCGIGHI